MMDVSASSIPAMHHFTIFVLDELQPSTDCIPGSSHAKGKQWQRQRLPRRETVHVISLRPKLIFSPAISAVLWLWSLARVVVTARHLLLEQSLQVNAVSGLPRTIMAHVIKLHIELDVGLTRQGDVHTLLHLYINATLALIYIAMDTRNQNA
jgi:hypothetical protein